MPISYIVLASLDRLADIAQVATTANRKNQLKGLLIREEGPCTTNDVLQSMNDAHLRILRQSDFKGLSERHLRRLEAGSPVSNEVMSILAAGHTMSLKAYLDEIARAIQKVRA